MVNSYQEPAAGLEENTEEGSHGDPCCEEGIFETTEEE